MRRLSIALAVVAVFAAALIGSAQLVLPLLAEQALARLQYSLPAGSTITAQPVKLEVWRLRAQMAKLQIRIPQGEDESVSFSAEQLAFSGLPIWKDRRFAFSQITLQGAEFIGNTTHLRAQNVNLTRLTLPAQWSANPVAILGQITSDAMSIEALSLSDPALSAPVTVKSSQLQGIAQGRAAKIIAEQSALAFTTAELGELKLAISRFEGTDFYFTGLLGPDGQLQPLTLFSQATLAGASARAVTLTTAHATKPLLYLPEIAITGESDTLGNRIAASLESREGVLDPQGLPAEMQEKLTSKAPFSFSLIATATYDPEKKQFDLTNFQLTAPNEFDARVQVSISNFQPPRTVDELIGGLMLIAIRDLTFTLTEHGAIKAYIAREAARLEVEPRVYIEQLIGSYRPAALDGAGAARIGEAYRALGAFLLNPGTLTLTLSPRQPLALITLMMNPKGPGYAAELLQLSLRQEPPAQTP